MTVITVHTGLVPGTSTKLATLAFLVLIWWRGKNTILPVLASRRLCALLAQRLHFTFHLMIATLSVRLSERQVVSLFVVKRWCAGKQKRFCREHISGGKPKTSWPHWFESWGLFWVFYKTFITIHFTLQNIVHLPTVTIITVMYRRVRYNVL